MSIKAIKIIHRGETRIKVDFPYNQAFIALLKQIENAKWSATHKAWHIPYTKEAFGKLKSLFPDILIDSIQEKKEEITQEEKPKTDSIIASKEVRLSAISSVFIEVIARKIILKLPKNEIDTKFILTLRFSRWDKLQKVWIVPNYPGNLEVIKEYFKDRISKITIHQEVELKTSAETYKIEAKDVLVIKTNGCMTIFVVNNRTSVLNISNFLIIKQIHFYNNLNYSSSTKIVR